MWAAIVSPSSEPRREAALAVIAKLRAADVSVTGSLQEAAPADAGGGWDAVDIDTGARLPIARRSSTPEMCDWAFEASSFSKIRGTVAESDATVVVLEFGMVEARGRGNWAAAQDVLASGRTLVACIRPQALARIALELPDPIAALELPVDAVQIDAFVQELLENEPAARRTLLGQTRRICVRSHLQCTECGCGGARVLAPVTKLCCCPRLRVGIPVRTFENSTLWLAIASLWLTGCTDDDSPAGTDGETDGGPAVIALFDLDADLRNPATFYDLPYPLDLRLAPDGSPDLSGMPITFESKATNQLLRSAQERPGFPSIGVGYFVFDGPIAAQDRTAFVPADVTSPVLLVDVDPTSPHRGTLYPTSTGTLPVDAYVLENMLAVGPYPGVVLPGDRTYAFVVMRSLGGADGRSLGVPDSLASLAAGTVPDGRWAAEAAQLYTPLWETLDTLGVARTEVASAAVFTVPDIPRLTFEMSERVRAQHPITIDGLALEPDGGAEHERFCELVATIEMPQFVRGVPPFSEDGGYDYDAEGTPIKQRDETVILVITIPKLPMPAGGYPLLHYIHGSAGLAAQVVDRGPFQPDGSQAPGLGPAHVVAEHGVAALGAGMPLNPERTPLAGDFDYINILNPRSFSQVFRQGVFEQRLILDAVETLSIDPTVLEGCDGPSLPAGETAYRFDLGQLVMMGQSMGAQYTNLTAAIDPRVRAVIPTGSGGLWTKFMEVSTLFGGVNQLAGGLLGIEIEDVNPLHPGLNMLGTAWEPGEQIVSLPHLARRPLPGHPVRHIYEPVGPEDEFFPETIFDAMAIAFGNQQTGEQVWPSMQEELAHFGQDGLAAYPISGNRTSENGAPYTGVVVQYPAPPDVNGHYIFQQLDEVKYQYGCFVATLLRDGTPTVPAPAPLGTPCP